MSILGYLQQREYDPKHLGPNKQAVKTWLGKLASKPTSNQPCEFSGEPRATFLVDFSPNRTKVASTHGDHTVRVTDIASGKCTHILAGHPRTPWCLAFHPASNDILASGCLGGEVRIWDLSGGGSEVWKSDNNAVISSLTFHPCDHVLVFATGNTVYFWDWSEPQPFTYCKTTYDYERVRWLRFDGFGHYLFTGICNNTTLHRRPATDVVHASDDTNQGRSGSGGQNPNWRQMQVNRQRYQALVQRFFHYQQERMQIGSNRPRGASAWGDDEGEGERPTSPVHIAALNDARDYASVLTVHAIDRARAADRLSQADSSRSSIPGEYRLYRVPRPGAHSPPPRPVDDEVPEPDQPVRQSDDMDRLASELGPGWRITPAPTLLAPPSQASTPSQPPTPQPGSSASETSSQSSSTSNAPQLNFIRSTLHRLGVDGSQPPPSGDSLFNVATEVAMSGWQSTGSDRSWPPVTTRSGTVSAAGSVFAGSYQPFVSFAQSGQSSATSTSSSGMTVADIETSDHRRNSSSGTSSVVDQSSGARQTHQSDICGVNRDPSSGGENNQNTSSSRAVNISMNSSHYSQAGMWGGASQATTTTQSQSSFSSAAGMVSSHPTAGGLNTGAQPAPKRSYSTAFGAAQPSIPSNSGVDSASQRSEGIHWLTGAAPTNTRPTDRAVGSQRPASSPSPRGRGRLALMLSAGATTSGLTAEGVGQRLPHLQSNQASSATASVTSHLRSCLTGARQPATSTNNNNSQSSQSITSGNTTSETNTSNRRGASATSSSSSRSIYIRPLEERRCEHSDPNDRDDNCPSCINFNLDLLDSGRRPVTNPSCLRVLQQRTATSAHPPPQHDPSVNLIPTSDGGYVLRRDILPSATNTTTARPRESLRQRLRHLRQQTQKMDGTSQTQGNLNMPEQTDQGTDVVGLGLPQRQGNAAEGMGEDAEMNEEEQLPAAEDQEMADSEPEESTADSSPPCTCGHASDPSTTTGIPTQSSASTTSSADNSAFAPANASAVRAGTPGHGHSCQGHGHSSKGHEHSQSEIPTAGGSGEGARVSPSPRRSGTGSEITPGSHQTGAVSGLTAHLEQQVSELDRRINVLRDTFNERMRVLNEDRRRLLSSLRSRMLRDPASEERMPNLADLQSRMADLSRIVDQESGSLSSLERDLALRQSTTSLSSLERDLLLRQATSGSLSSLDRDLALRQSVSGSTHFGGLGSSVSLPHTSELPRRPSLFGSSSSSASSSLLRSQLTNSGLPSASSTSSHSIPLATSSRAFASMLHAGLNQPPTSGTGASIASDIFNSTRDSIPSIPSGLAPGSRSSSSWNQRAASSSGFGSGSRARNMIEVLGPSGESETITYRELARRMANREDVMVVGDHRLRTPASSSSSQGGDQTPQHPLLETFLRADHPPLPPRRPTHPRAVPTIRVDRSASQDGPGQEGHEDHSWHALQQRHLHPHYSVSILDETINRPNDAVQMAINRAIAGVFMSSGEQAVASNIVPQTHRIQRWDFRQCQIPDLTQTKANIVVEHCKLHNDASIDLSQDFTLLATFVPSHRGFPDDNILAVFSLLPESFGQCLFTKSFGPNAISVSVSPENNYILVGLAAKRLSWVFTPNQLVGQIYWLKERGAGEMSMKHVTDVMHPCVNEGRPHVSVNSARWLPAAGDGIVYGTNRGDLHFFRTGSLVVDAGDHDSDDDGNSNNRSSGSNSGGTSNSSRDRSSSRSEGRRARRASQPDLRPQQVSSIATQTGTGSIHRSAFTQTSEEEGRE